METLVDWTTRISGGLSSRKIADAIGVAGTALSRWLRLKEIPARRVVQIARTFDADCIEGLVIAGYLTAEEAAKSAALQGVRGASDKTLVEELHRRVIEREVLAGLGREQAADQGA
jgi:transcriptional regulator with XRE-family HTH domain